MNAGKIPLAWFSSTHSLKMDPLSLLWRGKEMDDETKAVVCGVTGLVAILIAILFGVFTLNIILVMVLIVGLCFMVLAVIL